MAFSKRVNQLLAELNAVCVAEGHWLVHGWKIRIVRYGRWLVLSPSGKPHYVGTFQDALEDVAATLPEHRDQEVS